MSHLSQCFQCLGWIWHTSDAQQMSDELVNGWIKNVVCVLTLRVRQGQEKLLNNFKRLSVCEENFLRAVLS